MKENKIKMSVLVMLLLISTSRVMCQGPPISNVTVSLSSSVEEDGRQFACPGEHVTFTCEVNRSVIIRMAAEPFISRNDPASYVASSIIGSTTSGRNGTFQVNLTNLQRKSNRSRTANFAVTLTANTSDKTNNTVIECADQLYSDRVKRKTLVQSAQPYPPTGLSHRFECNNLNCISQELANGSTLITCTCQSYDLILRWNNTSGMFDVQHYLVNISGNITHVNTTSFTVRVMPETDYLVFIHTVSTCQQTSSPATINNGTVRAAGLIIKVLPGNNTNDTNGGSIGGIIGGSIGGAFIIGAFIIGIIVGVWLFISWKRNKERRKKSYPEKILKEISVESDTDLTTKHDQV